LADAFLKLRKTLVGASLDEVASQIMEQEGEYALALKENQGNLYGEVKATFALAEKEAFASLLRVLGGVRYDCPESVEPCGSLGLSLACSIVHSSKCTACSSPLSSGLGLSLT
jgi:hypothetical protein